MSCSTPRLAAQLRRQAQPLAFNLAETFCPFKINVPFLKCGLGLRVRLRGCGLGLRVWFNVSGLTLMLLATLLRNHKGSTADTTVSCLVSMRPGFHPNPKNKTRHFPLFGPFGLSKEASPLPLRHSDTQWTEFPPVLWCCVQGHTKTRLVSMTIEVRSLLIKGFLLSLSSTHVNPHACSCRLPEHCRGVAGL